MTLRLAQDPEVGTCGTCNGRGTMPVGQQFTRQGRKIAGGDARIPCPTCKGAKVVMKTEAKP